ncbi:LOW QUALITY PROTEIN: protein NEDD1-like [Saccoglossus kowalevskii]|uniref:LOW QUALITY PROTEIN: protein NEDD1-like n=1 Tax=Saccoglossus kowalevskii TaxID=10224 RepID=A0ABM0LYU2_SACKO|nr:PREDICTED: LOW QUALITY PROTEIN: protein NEDD1-like [Saccoglossus kowalevskii]
MSEMKLVSAGDDIKIWDTSSMNIIKQFNPHSSGLSCVRWSHCNNFLASAATVGDKITLTSLKKLPNIVSDHIADGEKQTTLAFVSNSRYVVSGGKNKVVSIWDAKTKKLKKTFKDHSDTVTCIAVNFNDTYIASGATNGNILLNNVITGQCFSPLTLPNAHAIRGLQYSHFKKHLMGSVSDDGSLHLWDSVARRHLASFTDTHRAPATDICFSPVNDMLIVTVGLDKRIVCYDAQGKSAIKTIVTDAPLTSVDFMNDGVSFAVGSSRGQIKLFDLRMSASPKSEIQAHKSSVQCLAYQTNSNKNDTISNKTRRTNVTSTVNSRKVPPVIGVDSGKAESDSAESEQENIDYGNKPTRQTAPVTSNDEVFSPLSNNDHYKNHYTPETYKIIPTAKDDVKEVNDPTSIFSPLSDNISNVPATTRRLPLSSGDDSPFMQPSSRLLPSTSTHHIITDTSPVITSPYPHVPSPGSIQPPVPVSNRNINNGFGSRPPVASLSEIAPVRVASRHFPSISSPTVSSPYLQTPTTLPSTSQRGLSGSSSSSVSADIAGDGEGAVGGAPLASSAHQQPFQVEFIRNMIDDAVEDARMSLHRDVVNLQVEMIRQFQIQMYEMRQEMAKYSVNEALVAEIERLKEENRQLKTKY